MNFRKILTCAGADLFRVNQVIKHPRLSLSDCEYEGTLGIKLPPENHL